MNCEDKYGPKGNLKKRFNVSCQHYSFAIKAFVETVKQYETNAYELGIHEEKTLEVIHDVGQSRSDVGILYLSDFNRKYMHKLFEENDLQFHACIRL